jgi:cyclophilin family peptidyl-prolyl cis-trans isomerase
MTTKGEIKMQLMARNAPATVANFVKLSKSGFFTGKTFHRVVPNFVVQTGCIRGDGYGSMDFNIRSELSPLHYETEGYVGMASAGVHTESSQWFITQSPAMHLDPNYTIFAKVVSGMNVVNLLGVGDVVQSVVIQ